MKHQRIIKGKVLRTLLIVGVFVLFFVMFYTPSLRMPISWAPFWVGIKAEPSYIPFEYSESYMTSTSCGKNCHKLKIHYLSTEAELVVTATDYVSWYDDPKWDKEALIKGTKYYYHEKNGKQYWYWEVEKEELELAIEYKSENELAKSEIVKIANSIKADGKLLN
ncbi:hypothetical protein WQ54_07795 [Bacillus sp. SA1-12]|uniref:hypothetical protein n=1 Tax=Bacillus sp. SA1-12 TaxID=1455638 RepID=UPI000625FF65|nr:hypothetical protein [Bacillus sp. SA1-12]KKI92772.1 hypothetical protein WQ54_07795 [Bacillus sp. SA1-12]